MKYDASGKKEQISFFPDPNSHPVKRTVKYWESCGNYAYPVVRYNNKDCILMNFMHSSGVLSWIINNDENRKAKYSFSHLKISA